jgi:DNA repair exonuclease SbcCD ATPase subunit
MKEIKLNKLVLENFKCFQQLEIDFNGQDLVINGANGTGKTTIMDALNWLLFKKNSHGDQDFSVKPLDKNGNSKKSVVISVYGEFVVNGDLVTFKRTMEEQWTRKRGSKDATFTGNTYSYEINGVPASSEKAYKEAVADLCDETLFRLITNPHYFSNLDKKEKRKILMDALKTNIDDIAIITANEDLYELRKYIVANTIEELQSIKKKEIKELTKNLNEYVPRIDELSKLVDDTLTEDETNLEIENLKVQIDIVKDKIKLMSSSNDVQSNLALINELNAELLKLKSELLVAEKENPNKKERQDEIEKSENKLVDLRRQDRENEMQIVSITSEIKQTEKAIITYTQNSLLLNERINNLRNQAKEIFRKQFDESETILSLR